MTARTFPARGAPQVARDRFRQQIVDVTYEELAARLALARDDGGGPRFRFGEGAFPLVESQACFSVPFIRAMTFEAILGQQRQNVPTESD